MPGISTLHTERVRDSIREHYIDQMSPGERLPPQAHICKEFSVSPGTVVKAMAALEQQGLVVRHQGRGTFIADRKPPEIGLIVSPGSMAYVDSLLDSRPFRGSTAYRYHVIPKTARLNAEAMSSLNLSGVVCQGVHAQDPLLQPFFEQHIPVVLTDASDSDKVDFVGKDSFRAGQRAAEVLFEAGHTRIAYVGYMNYDEERCQFIPELDSEQQQAGIIAAYLEKNRDPDPDLFVRHRISDPQIRRENTYSCNDILQHFAKMAEPPTALILFSDHTVGVWMYQALADAHIYVPEDLSIIALGFIEDKSRMTCVGSSWAATLRRALEQVQSRMNYGLSEDVLRSVVNVSVVDRGTVAAAPVQSPFKRLRVSDH